MKPVTGYLVAAALGLAMLTGLASYKVGYDSAAARYDARFQKHLRESAEAASEAVRQAREYEVELAASQLRVAEAYERGKRDAEITSMRIINDLRDGNLRLRDHWGSCEALRVSDAAEAAREFDEAARNREESAARIVRAAAECDAQVIGLQELLLLERRQWTSADDSSRR